MAPWYARAGAGPPTHRSVLTDAQGPRPPPRRRRSRHARDQHERQRPCRKAAAIPGCAKASLNRQQEGKLTIGTDNPAFPPWWGGTPKKPWKVSDPASGQGYESAVAYGIARRLGFGKGAVEWVAVPFNKSFAPGKKDFDFYMAQVSYRPERAKNGLLQRAVLLREPGRRRAEGEADHEACARSPA